MANGISINLERHATQEHCILLRVMSTLGFWDACVPELDCEVTIWTYAESTFDVYIVKLSHINY